jgi:hypothetical protein
MTSGPGETDPSQSLGGERSSGAPPTPAARVTFDRRELSRILGLYGRKVAEGEWRDYASATGLIVRRGHELDRVLRAIDRSLSLVVN